jgi:GAF domain-containing protein
LRAADAWRRERVQFSQHALDRAAALKAVNEIGIALSSERNPDRLLELILTRARHLVTADAGSIYLVRKGEQEHRAATVLCHLAHHSLNLLTVA